MVYWICSKYVLIITPCGDEFRIWSVTLLTPLTPWVSEPTKGTDCVRQHHCKEKAYMISTLYQPV